MDGLPTTHKDFHQLDIWRNGYEALMKIYDVTATFPPDERYSITSQILRSANSTIANIAESHGRFSYNDKIRVLYIARGEICETRSHLAVALGRKYISKDRFITLNNIYCQLSKNLNLYINSLKR